MIGGGILKYISIVLGFIFLLSLTSCNGNKDKSVNPATTITTDTVTKEIEEYYQVTFIDYDDSILTIVNVKKGDTAVYDKDMPKREADDEFYYEFKGWDMGLENVTKSFTVKAEYNKTAKVDWNEIEWF